MPAYSQQTIRAARRRSLWRALLALCVLVVFLGIQIASASHLHADCDGHTHKHDCAICHAGHIPVVAVTSGISAAPISLTAWRLQREEFAAGFCRFAASRSSRAPPA